MVMGKILEIGFMSKIIVSVYIDLIKNQIMAKAI